MLAEMIAKMPIGLAVSKQYEDIETTPEQYAQNRTGIRSYIQ